MQMKSLVVEDDTLSRMLLFSILSRFGQCDIAENGKQAVKNVRNSLAEGKPYDVICLDIIMPVLDGYTALLEIRELERIEGTQEHKLMKVIMVTAVDDFDQIVKSFEEGHCEAYLAKPIREGEILQHLYELELIESI
jgi:two-component system, chemotaxis family, chemotaxis protein CheY